VVGLVERKGDLRAFTAENANSTTLTQLVTDNVDREATVMTDD